MKLIWIFAFFDLYSVRIKKPPPYDGMDAMLASQESNRLTMDVVIHLPIIILFIILIFVDENIEIIFF